MITVPGTWNVRQLFLWSTIFALLVVAYHFLISLLMRHHGVRLGAVRPKLAPLFAAAQPHFDIWLLWPVLLIGILLMILARTDVLAQWSDRKASGFFFVAALVVAVSVCMIDGGPGALVESLIQESEYLLAVREIEDPIQFLSDYPTRMETLPMHPSTHPPGALMFLWMVEAIFGTAAMPAALAIVFVGAATTVPVFFLARSVGDGRLARFSTAIFLLVPSVVMFTATSVDGLFAFFLVCSAWFFHEALRRRPGLWGLATGVALGISTWMTYSVAVLGLLLCIEAAMLFRLRPELRHRLLTAVVAALVGYLAFFGALWAKIGYDPWQSFVVALELNREIWGSANSGNLSDRAHQSLAGAVVFFLYAGVPCTVLWWRRLATLRRDRTVDTMQMALLLTLLVILVAPLYVLEVERILIFLVPLVVIPVAATLSEHGAEQGIPANRSDRRLLGFVLLAIATQGVVSEVLLYTYW